MPLISCWLGQSHRRASQTSRWHVTSTISRGSQVGSLEMQLLAPSPCRAGDDAYPRIWREARVRRSAFGIGFASEGCVRSAVDRFL